MMFKELKAGYPVYLFDRASLAYEQAKVMNVLPNYSVGNYGKMEVNITIQTKDGKQNTYSVADTEQSAYAGNLLVSTSKECVINEINALRNNSDEILQNVDSHKRIVKECDKLLAELDTGFRDKKNTERRLDTLEQTMQEILKYVKPKN